MAKNPGIMCNTTELAALTGRAKETVKKLVQGSGVRGVKEGNALLFDSQVALPLIYEIGGDGEGGYALNAERARLSHHQANLAELKVETEKGNLIPSTDVLKNWESLTMNWKAKMLTLPSTTVHELSQTNNKQEIMELLTDAITHTFEELIIEENESHRQLQIADGESAKAT